MLLRAKLSPMSVMVASKLSSYSNILLQLIVDALCPLALARVNAEKCYDKIVHIPASLAWQ